MAFKLREIFIQSWDLLVKKVIISILSSFILGGNNPVQCEDNDRFRRERATCFSDVYDLRAMKNQDRFGAHANDLLHSHLLATAHFISYHSSLFMR